MLVAWMELKGSQLRGQKVTSKVSLCVFEEQQLFPCVLMGGGGNEEQQKKADGPQC